MNLRSTATRALYQLQHRTMLEVAARATGLWHLAMAAPHIPYGNRDALIERMLELFQQDLANADAGYYPRSLVVDFPFFRYLAAAPGALTDGPRILWNLTISFAFLELFQAFLCWIIEGHKTVPFFVQAFAHNMKHAFGRQAIAFHFFIVQTAVTKHHRVGGIPALRIKHL